MDLRNSEVKSASEIEFEQYKLYIEMADKVSERRNNVNTFLWQYIPYF